ncbi:MAG: hypothetical protein ABL903_04930 [Methylococcales bacterium]
MISEIDLLKEDIPNLEQRFGVNNLFVEVLKAQLASLQNPKEPIPEGKKSYFGFRSVINAFIAKHASSK